MGHGYAAAIFERQSEMLSSERRSHFLLWITLFLFDSTLFVGNGLRLQ